ncbi:MAG: Na+/H+ antiporter subunit E [Rhodobacteraceae bacterium]|nr:Na+/H+ antiporter subunit E [Paracoccaceae bacterium]
MLSRLFPHPLLTLVLAVVWLLLVNTVTLNAIVFALLLGLLLPQVIRAYWPDMPTLRNPVAIAGYVLIVLLDIVKANIQVALIVLFKPAARLRPAWVRVPLDLKTPEAITVLAGTITMTPGTVSCDLSDDGHALLVHCLHAPEPASVVDEIKQRYERRLKEIFE